LPNGLALAGSSQGRLIPAAQPKKLIFKILAQTCKGRNGAGRRLGELTSLLITLVVGPSHQKKEEGHLNLSSIFKKSRTRLPRQVQVSWQVISNDSLNAILGNLLVVIGFFWPFQEQSFTSAKTISL
jgi:hypothetical protein